MKNIPRLPIKPWILQPKEKETKKIELKRTEIYDGEDISEHISPNKKYYFDINSDDDGKDYYIVEYEEITTPNPEYDSQLKEYQKIMGRYEAEKTQYEKDLKEWEQEQKEIRERQERELYEKLSLKYGKK